MSNYGFGENLIGANMVYDNAKADPSGLHDNHLHSGENSIKVKLGKE